MQIVFIYLLILGMLMFGTVGSLVNKAMDKQSAKGHEFNHPYFQTATMFFGESFCLVAYRIYIYYKPKPRQSIRNEPLLCRTGKLYKKLGNFIFMFPAFFDLVASTLTFIGLVLSAVSVYQKMRGFIIVVVAVNSVVFLKKKIFRHQIIGVIFATIGIAIVGVTSILFQTLSAPKPCSWSYFDINCPDFQGLDVHCFFYQKLQLTLYKQLELKGFVALGTICFYSLYYILFHVHKIFVSMEE